MYDSEGNLINCEAKNCYKPAQHMVVDAIGVVQKLCEEHSNNCLIRQKGRTVDCPNCACRMRV